MHRGLGLTHLDLRHNRLGRGATLDSRGAARLAAGLGGSRLRTLDLQENHLHSHDLVPLCEALKEVRGTGWCKVALWA